MATDAFVIRPADYEAIARVVLEQMHKSRTTEGREGNSFIDREETFPPEFYVAKTPAGGIPASVLPGGSGSGTGSGSGSGTGLGAADCDVYRAVVWNMRLTLTATGFKHRIHSLSDLPVAGGAWVEVARDKYGTWWAVGGSAVGGSGAVTEVEVGEPYYTGVTPPLPLLMDWRLVFYNLTTDDFDPGPSVWVSDANATRP